MPRFFEGFGEAAYELCGNGAEDTQYRGVCSLQAPRVVITVVQLFLPGHPRFV